MDKHKAKAVATFEQKLNDSRKQRNEKLAQEMLGHDPKKLAQEMLGRNRRTSTPKASTGAGSLASRVGVNKRSNSLPRMNSNPINAPRGPRQPSTLGRSVTTDAPPNTRRERPIQRPAAPPTRPAASELNIRGAAAGSYIVIAQNFAPGTTAADIESVLQTVGGEVTYCRLVSKHPTVIAEIGFVEKAGADKVIATFNNKRADGRLLYVYFQNDGGATASGYVTLQQDENDGNLGLHHDSMEVDANAESREEQDRLREQRRGRAPRGELQNNEFRSNYRPRGGRRG